MPNPWDYFPVSASIGRVRMYGNWVMVKEELERRSDSGLVIPPASATTVGSVIAIGDSASERYGVKVGDRVIYERWQGGRWQIGDEKVLIMDVENILAVVEGR